MPNPSLLSMLARSFLAGESETEAIVARCSQTLGRPWGWLRPLAQQYVESVAGKTRPRHRDVVRFISQEPGYERALRKHSHELSVEHWLTESQRCSLSPRPGHGSFQLLSPLAAWPIGFGLSLDNWTGSRI